MPRVVISGVEGPLFVVAVDAAQGVPSEECQAARAALETHYGQFYKKLHGWRLAIEELEYLLVTAATHDMQVVLDTPLVCAQRALLRARCNVSCAIYHALTTEHRYKLRHGTQFGALFIGYNSLERHGDCLFFLGPLDALLEVAATRVAVSVGKRCYECVWRDALSLRELVPPRHGRRARHKAAASPLDFPSAVSL